MEILVLASGSPWRRKMLLDAGLQVESVLPLVDESEIVADTPFETAKRRALAKAEAVAVTQPGRWVLGADQVLALDGECLGKPADAQNHFDGLQRLRGREHTLCTAWSLRGPGQALDAFAYTGIRMRADVSDEELWAYVDCAEARGCAGGYMLEGRGAWLIERVSGDAFNVMGLPVLDVLSALRARGWRFGA